MVMLLFLGLGGMAKAQTPEAAFGKITAAIQRGDDQALATWFHSTVEVTLPGAEGTYSAQQAGFVFKDFFTKYAPQKIALPQTGASGSFYYAQGVFSSGKGDLDVNIFLKQINGEFKITQIRFEND